MPTSAACLCLLLATTRSAVTSGDSATATFPSWHNPPRCRCSVSVRWRQLPCLNSVSISPRLPFEACRPALQRPSNPCCLQVLFTGVVYRCSLQRCKPGSPVQTPLKHSPNTNLLCSHTRIVSSLSGWATPLSLIISYRPGPALPRAHMLTIMQSIRHRPSSWGGGGGFQVVYPLGLGSRSSGVVKILHGYSW